MKSLHISLCALIVAIACPLTALASNATSSAGTDAATSTPTVSFITPPSGWEHKNVPMTFGPFTSAGMWVPPSHEHEAIDIGTSPTGGATFSAFIAQVKKGLEAFAGASGVKVWQAAKVCNATQDGWYGEVLLKMGDHTVTEDLTLALGDKAYMATYARDEALPLDHSAHSALYTLCAAADSAGTSTGGNTPAAPTTPTPATDDHIAKADVHDPAARAHEWFNRMRVGDIDSTQLTATMNAALTKETVKNVSGVLTALGTPTAFTPLQSMHRDGETAYAYMLRFPAAKIREVITINDKDNLIDGLFFQPAN